MLNMVIGGSFRTYIWDPFLIISQIIAIQCLYYCSFGFIMSILFVLNSTSPSVAYIFNQDYLNIASIDNTLVVVATLINALCAAVYLCFIVQRAKLCLDFTCTVHFLHMVFCWAYYGKLLTFSSLIIQLIAISITAVFGEYLCFKNDMKPINLGGTRADL